MQVRQPVSPPRVLLVLLGGSLPITGIGLKPAALSAHRTAVVSEAETFFCFLLCLPHCEIPGHFPAGGFFCRNASRITAPLMPRLM